MIMNAKEAKRLTDITNYNFEQYLANFEQDRDIYLKSVFAKIGEATQKGTYSLIFNFLSELGITFPSKISIENEGKFICHLLDVLSKEYHYSTSAYKVGVYFYQINWDKI